MNRADRRRRDKAARRSQGGSRREPRPYDPTSQVERERFNAAAIKRGVQKRRDDPERWTPGEVEVQAHAEHERQADHSVEAADVWDGRVLPVTEPGAYIRSELIYTSVPDFDWDEHWRSDQRQAWRYE